MFSVKTQPHTQQRGAILVTSMLLLLVLTIIGVTVMQMSRMQERMAGNSRDINLAFQAAEGALRGAEAFVEALNDPPVNCSTSPCEIWAEGSIEGTTANQNAEWWETNGQTFGLEPIDGVRETPGAVIEQLAFVSTDGGGLVRGHDVPDGRDFFQVTARSTGGSGEAEIVLQSTYATKF